MWLCSILGHNGPNIETSFSQCFTKPRFKSFSIAFLVFSICFHKTVHSKGCLGKIVGQIVNDLKRGFVKHWLNDV